MDTKNKSIIIKKVKKVSGGGHHGGSWKVAYADFVTAMMAFFLLLWLITMASPEKRAAVSTYFKHFSIFKESGTSFMEKSSEVFREAGEAAPQLPKEFPTTFAAKPEQVMEAIKGAIELKLGDIKDQVMVDLFEGGVRIQLADREGQAMFEVGSARPTSLAGSIMKVIGDNIASLPNAVAVEGHTDSLSYKSTSYGNWELSTERALAARKELERYGIHPDRIAKVAGYAATVPFVKENPADPRNRRISIILLFPKNETGAPVPAIGAPRAQ